jgi:hypothetical protein
MARSTGKAAKLTKKDLEEKVKQLEAAVANREPSKVPTPTVQDDKPKSVHYTDYMTTCLLELRYQAYGVAFRGSKSKQQLAQYWRSLTARFNILTEQDVPVHSE